MILKAIKTGQWEGRGMMLKISYTAVNDGRPVVNVPWNHLRLQFATHSRMVVAKVFLFEKGNITAKSTWFGLIDCWHGRYNQDTRHLQDSTLPPERENLHRNHSLPTVGPEAEFVGAMA